MRGRRHATQVERHATRFSLSCGAPLAGLFLSRNTRRKGTRLVERRRVSGALGAEKRERDLREGP